MRRTLVNLITRFRLTNGCHLTNLRHMAGTLLTTAETAAMLGRSPRTVARLAAEGELPYVQKLEGVRGSYLFDRGTVQLFARQRRDRRKRGAA